MTQADLDQNLVPLAVPTCAEAYTAPEKHRLKVCVLQSSYEDSATPFKDLDPYAKPEVYDPDGYFEWHNALIEKNTAEQQIYQLSKQDFDVFINLCDGAPDEDRAGVEVVCALEKYSLPYTGGDERFYALSKQAMKELAQEHGVPVPSFAFISQVADLRSQVQHMSYPMIVKHFNGYGSVGMGKDSRVTTLHELETQVLKFIRLCGTALVEEFIEGREFTVLVSQDTVSCQPISYVPVECIFPKGETFKHFDMKWTDYEGIQWLPVKDDSGLDAKLRDVACRAFVALHGCSYGRCDIRVDAQGNVYLLEINPNCGLFYPPDAMGSADFILSLDPTTNPLQFIKHITSLAMACRARKQHS